MCFLTAVSVNSTSLISASNQTDLRLKEYHLSGPKPMAHLHRVLLVSACFGFWGWILKGRIFALQFSTAEAAAMERAIQKYCMRVFFDISFDQSLAHIVNCRPTCKRKITALVSKVTCEISEPTCCGRSMQPYDCSQQGSVVTCSFQ